MSARYLHETIGPEGIIVPTRAKNHSSTTVRVKSIKLPNEPETAPTIGWGKSLHAILDLAIVLGER